MRSVEQTPPSFNKLLLQKEELEQKHVHLLQVVESEKTAKWQYTQQCEELASEIRKLRAEVRMGWRRGAWVGEEGIPAGSGLFVSLCVCVCESVALCPVGRRGTTKKVINRP